MTGLDPARDRIIEIATVVTDKQLNVLAEGPVIADPPGRARSRPWTNGTRASMAVGLLERVRQTRVTEREAELATLTFLSRTRAGRLADVRQQHLPGPAFPGALDARAGALLPLPQSRCQHAQGAGAPLGARRRGRHSARNLNTSRWRTSAIPSRNSSTTGSTSSGCHEHAALLACLRAQSRPDFRLPRRCWRRARVVEIGSGTGQHAAWFAPRLPALRWVTTDLPGNHAGIRAWIAASGAANLEGPLALDALRALAGAGRNRCGVQRQHGAHHAGARGGRDVRGTRRPPAGRRAVLPVRALHGAGPAHQRKQRALRRDLRARILAWACATSPGSRRWRLSRASMLEEIEPMPANNRVLYGDGTDRPADADDVFAAAARIAPFVHRTPVLTSRVAGRGA
jgi:hypothetical protein